MQKFNYRLLILGMLMILGISSAVSANTLSEVTETNDDAKIPKGMSRLSVKTDEPMRVYLDGVQVGKTQGNQVEFLYDVTPGNHEVKVMNDEGKSFIKTESFNKGVKYCVCLKTNRNEIRTPCPYNISVSGESRVREGDSVVFTADNKPSPGTTGTAPLSYIWKVKPDNARITSGLGTNAITIDTTGLGDQTVTAEVEVTDGYFDEKCRQRIPANTFVEKPRKEPFVEIDMVTFKVFDDVKLRLDNYMTQLQNRVDGTAYMIFYQGTEKKAPDAKKTSDRVVDYLVKRGFLTNRINVIQGGPRSQTTIGLFITYPAGEIPIP